MHLIEPQSRMYHMLKIVIVARLSLYQGRARRHQPGMARDPFEGHACSLITIIGCTFVMFCCKILLSKPAMWFDSDVWKFGLIGGFQDSRPSHHFPLPANVTTENLLHRARRTPEESLSVQPVGLSGELGTLDRSRLGLLRTFW
jgi:hypothetical protein